MAVMEMGGVCNLCNLTAPRNTWPIKEPYCIACMTKIKDKEDKAQWFYPPSFVDDLSLWCAAVVEIASALNEAPPTITTNGKR